MVVKAVIGMAIVTMVVGFVVVATAVVFLVGAGACRGGGRNSDVGGGGDDRLWQ